MEKIERFLVVMVLRFFINNLLAQSKISPDFVLTIPAERKVDWHNVGDKLIPSSYNKVFNVLEYGAIPNDNSDDRQAIQNAIDSARVYNSSHSGSFCVVYLPQGIYTFSSGGITMINNIGDLDYSNICLKGDGSDKTILSFSSNYTGKAIDITGEFVGRYHLLMIKYIIRHIRILLCSQNSAK